MYTTFVLIASSPIGSTPRVVIDWADIALDSTGVGAALEMLLEWVRTSPEPSAIQVVLPPVRRSADARRLQGSLQSLGCTVTCRSLGRRFVA